MIGEEARIETKKIGCVLHATIAILRFEQNAIDVASLEETEEIAAVEEAEMVTAGIKDSEAEMVIVEEAEMVTAGIKDSETETGGAKNGEGEIKNKLETVIGIAKVVVTIISHSEQNVTDVENQKLGAKRVNVVKDEIITEAAKEDHKEGKTVEVIHVEDLEIMATVQEIIVVDKEEAEVQTILEIEIDAENT